MTGIARKAWLAAHDRVAKAEAALKQHENKSYDEAAVVDRLIALHRKLIDPEAAARKRARDDLELVKRPCPEWTDDDKPVSQEQLELFGDIYDFGAERRISYDGELIRNEFATVAFKREEFQTADTNFKRVRKWRNRKKLEWEHHRKWAAEETRNGRNPLDLTWRQCAVETGVLRIRPMGSP